MWKFADLYQHLSRLGLATDENVHQPLDDPPHQWFEAVHDPSYYRAFLNGQLGEVQERRIGFREEARQAPLITRTRLECSGTVRTVELALEHGLAANLAGGTHHAHRSFGSGFTILNDLAVATAWARNNAGIGRVLIVDLDVHQGTLGRLRRRTLCTGHLAGKSGLELMRAAPCDSSWASNGLAR